jgi:hypothetical protein
VDRHAPELPCLPRCIADDIASSVGALERRKEQLPLCVGGQKFDGGGQFHTLNIAYSFDFINMLKISLPSFPALLLRPVNVCRDTLLRVRASGSPKGHRYEIQ